MSVRKAIIPIAGRGTRQLPATWAIPKAMMPMVDRDGLAKPLLHLLIAEAFSAGIERVALVVSPGQQGDVERYFRRFDDDLVQALVNKPELLAVSEQLGDWGRRVECIEQPTPEGFGHAVWCAKDWLGNEPFLLMLGDYLFVSDEPRSCAQQVVDVFEQHRPAAISGMYACDAETLPRVGVMRGRPLDDRSDLFVSQLIVEKPSLQRARAEIVTPGLPPNTWLAHFGNHVFTSAIMDELDTMVRQNIRERGEIQMTAAQERLRAAGAPYLALLVSGRAYDAGIPAGWLQAQQALSSLSQG
ncbi:MAG: UTP--glucose-1-phosphate uridylyltransferase [Phycisphaerae bacterium]|nr:UTP--glucose-1-phosphate uridylyltransferase [Phycisphaerae bacterium]